MPDSVLCVWQMWIYLLVMSTSILCWWNLYWTVHLCEKWKCENLDSEILSDGRCCICVLCGVKGWCFYASIEGDLQWANKSWCAKTLLMNVSQVTKAVKIRLFHVQLLRLDIRLESNNWMCPIHLSPYICGESVCNWISIDTKIPFAHTICVIWH